MIERSASAADVDIDEFFRSGFTTDNELITEAIRRMLAAGGKRLRPRMTLLAAEATGAVPHEHLALAAYMELIHVATLIHDDVVDGAETRRGVNATAVDFGNRISVLAGDYLFAWIFKNVTANYPSPVPHILSATLAAICDGEVLQIRAMGNLDLSVDEYIEVVERKTASLFAASAECGAIMGGGTPAQIEALRDYGTHYGIAFQMMDDLLDATSDAKSLGKPVGSDLREHKMTLPLIVALEAGGPAFRAQVSKLFASDEDEAASAAVLAEMKRLGTRERTLKVIAGSVDRAKLALVPLGNQPARGALVALAERLRDG